MYIVILQDHTIHSAWETKREAMKQAEVLANHGYYNGRPYHRNLTKYVKRDDTALCRNGYYYV